MDERDLQTCGTTLTFGKHRGRDVTARSGLLTRAGIGLFWFALIAIVAARALWFQPDVFSSLQQTPPAPHAQIGR